MLRATSFPRYAVKLKRNLPHGQEISPVLSRPYATVAQQCHGMLAAVLGEIPQTKLAPWQQVMGMQASSYFHVLRQLLGAKGVRQVERLFEADPFSSHPLGKDKGCGRKLRRGEHLPADHTIAKNAQRLGQLGVTEPLSISVDCFQLLWLALLIEEPIADAGYRYVKAHSWYDMERFFYALHGVDGNMLFRSNLPRWMRFDYGSMPRLAGCLVLLRHCVEIGMRAEARLVAPAVCRMLALLGPELHERGIAASLFDYCARHILPLAELTVSPARIAQASAALNVAAMSTLDHLDSLAVAWLERSAVMASILHGEFGPDLQQLCDPMNSMCMGCCWDRIRTSELPWLNPRGAARWWRPTDEIISVPRMLIRQPGVDSWFRPPLNASKPHRPRAWCDGLSVAGDSSAVSVHATSNPRRTANSGSGAARSPSARA